MESFDSVAEVFLDAPYHSHHCYLWQSGYVKCNLW